MNASPDLMRRANPVPHEDLPEARKAAIRLAVTRRMENPDALPAEIRRQHRLGWEVALASAVAVLLLIGGAAWLGGVLTFVEDLPVGDQIEEPLVEEPTEPETQPTELDGEGLVETPSLIEGLPEGLESGTIATPLGPMGWVHVTGDADTVPGHVWDMRAVQWPSGFAIFQPPKYDIPEGQAPPSARLWVSTDGIKWRLEALPIDPAAEGASLRLDDAAYWLTSIDPNGLWRSTDGTTWYEYDATALAPPGPAWRTDRFGLVATNDLALAHANFGAGNSNTTPDRNAERLYIIGDSEITPADVPWPTSTSVAEGFNHVTLFAAGDWAYAYVLNEIWDESGSIISSQVTVWRTNDGRSWTELGPLQIPDLPASHKAEFTSSADLLTITFFDTSGSAVAVDVAWETTDGVTWSPMPEGRPDGTHPVRVESGWFSTVGDQGGPIGGADWWMNVGDAWVALADLEIGACGGSSITAVDDTTFISGRGCVADLWVLRLDPSG